MCLLSPGGWGTRCPLQCGTRAAALLFLCFNYSWPSLSRALAAHFPALRLLCRAAFCCEGGRKERSREWHCTRRGRWGWQMSSCLLPAFPLKKFCGGRRRWLSLRMRPRPWPGMQLLAQCWFCRALAQLQAAALILQCQHGLL